MILNEKEANRHLDEILENKYLKKIEFGRLKSNDIIIKLIQLKQIEEIKLTSADININILRSIIISLQKFPSLKKLTIQNFYDTKYFPNEIYNLKDLTHLSINLTKIERLSKNISNLSNLIELDISMNKIHLLPSSIMELKNLEKINISYNGFLEIQMNFQI